MSPTTQKGYAKVLRILASKVDLTNPEATERHILGLDCKNKYENNLLSGVGISVGQMGWSGRDLEIYVLNLSQ